MVRSLLPPHVEIRLVENPLREIDGVATVMPEEVVDPRARLAVHVQVRAAEEVRLDDHVMQVEGALADPPVDFAVRARKPPSVGDHADFARLALRVQHPLCVGEIKAHRNLDLDVLALRQGEQRLLAVLFGGGRQNDRIDTGPLDTGGEVRRLKRNIPLLREFPAAFVGAAGNRHHFHAVNFFQRLHVNGAHRSGTRQTNLHRDASIPFLPFPPFFSHWRWGPTPSAN